MSKNLKTIPVSFADKKNIPIFEELGIRNAEELDSFLNGGRYSLKAINTDKTKISYRVINHWTENGLIDENRSKDNSKGWRRFSLCDLIWLQVLYTLRTFGLSIKQLQAIKKHLFLRVPMDGAELTVMALESSVCDCIAGNECSLIVYATGEAFINNDPALLRRLDRAANHDAYVKVSLNRILEQIIAKNEVKEEVQ